MPLDFRNQMSVSGIKCQISDERCQIPDIRCKMSDVKCQIPDVRYQMSDTRCQIPDIIYQMSVPDVRYQMSDTRCHIPDVRYHMSDSRCQIKVARCRTTVVRCQMSGNPRLIHSGHQTQAVSCPHNRCYARFVLLGLVKLAKYTKLPITVKIIVQLSSYSPEHSLYSLYTVTLHM